MSAWRVFFAFDGRLNRKRCWFANLWLALAAVIIAACVSGIVYVLNKPATQQQLLRAVWPWLMPFALMLAYPLAAVTAKRLHDRNKPGSLAALLIVPMLVESWLDPTFSGGEPQSSVSYGIYVGAAVMTWMVAIWFLIELGFMRGSAGDNKYGADPLAPAQAG